MFKQSSLRLAALILAFTALPAAAQSALPLTVLPFGPDYTQLGQHISFSFVVSYGNQPQLCGDNFCFPDTTVPLTNATLTAQLPLGVSFLSVSQGTVKVSGSGATGQKVTISLGTLQFHSNNTNLYFTDLLTVSAASNADSLQAVFQMSGNAADGSTATSPSASLPFQAGLKPVEVFAEEYFGKCDSLLNITGVGGAQTDSKTSRTGASLGGDDTLDGAAAAFNTDGLGVNPLLPGDFSASVKIGILVGPGASVTLSGLGAEVSANGGFGPTTDPSVPSFPFAPSTGNSSCEVLANLQFGNPNPFPVALNIDDQSSGYAAASDSVAKDPISGVVFGFPGGCGGVFDADSTAVVNFLVPGNGIESVRASRRKLLTSTGTTIETKAFQSCFDDAPASTCSNPDVTQSEPGIADNGTFFPTTSPFTVGASTLGANDQPRFSPNYLVNTFTPQCGGGTNFARDAGTGEVSLIRSGYGLSTISQRVIVMLASDDPNTIEASTPATLEIAGHSPVTLLVTDSNGHRVGLIPAVAPAPPATGQPKIDQPSTIVSEIFGASYSGMNSLPQVILIPFPKPGDYTVLATGTGSGPFTVTMQTLNVNGVVLSGQETTGTASLGSSSTIGLTIQSDGSITLSSTCATDASGSVKVMRSGYSYSIVSKRYAQTITLTNLGSNTITGPISLVLDSLSSNATLFNPAGTTACAAPAGSPYMTIAGSLNPGASVSAVVQFTDPTKTGISYTTRVLGGGGSR